MTEEFHVELFVIKCSIITRGIRAVYISQSLAAARGTLEAQADSLVSEYIKQVNTKTLSDAARMSEFYKLFYALENDIRDLVASTMLESQGDKWWATSVPQAVRGNVKKIYDREAAEGLPPRSDRLIDYTTFGELGDHS